MRIIDFWTQNELPKLSDLPDLGANELKKYNTLGSKFQCFALTYNGKSLFDVLKLSKQLPENTEKGYCSVRCAAQIGIELTKSIKELHDLGYLHLDIKPDNILIDNMNSGKLCIIDFGISEKYIDQNGNQLPPKSLVNIAGNLVYMSKNAFSFQSQSRCDDLIGIVYMLIEFVNGRLPW